MQFLAFYIVSHVTSSELFLLSHYAFSPLHFVLHCWYTSFQKVRPCTEQKKKLFYYPTKKLITRR